MRFTDFSFHNLRAFVRVDFNVPINLKTGDITDDTRMRAALPTLLKIINDGGSAVVAGHLGRPEGRFQPAFSMKNLAAHLMKLLKEKGADVPVFFAADCIGVNTFSQAQNLQAGQILLLENLRFHKEEKKGDPVFAQQLAQLASVYVNDAFGTAHRADASVAVIAQFFEKDKKMFGLLMEREIHRTQTLLQQPERPFTVILGGAKISDKLPIITHLLEKADRFLIGGGMAYTFLKAQGHSIGNSIYDENNVKNAAEILHKAAHRGIKIYLPVDHIAVDTVADTQSARLAMAMPDNALGVDIGEQTQALFRSVIESSKAILWNGPMGIFEQEAYARGTYEVAKAVADTTRKGAYSLVGGGDSVAALHHLGITDGITHISTGGGALLQLLEGKTLAAIAAIQG